MEGSGRVWRSKKGLKVPGRVQKGPGGSGRVRKGFGVCKVIIISNSTAVKVVLSCIEVRLGF